MVLKVTLSVWLQIISSLIKYNTYNIIVVLYYYKEKFKNGKSLKTGLRTFKEQKRKRKKKGSSYDVFLRCNLCKEYNKERIQKNKEFWNNFYKWW